MVDVPIAGEEILYTWGDDVAERLNREIQLMTTSDQSSNSTTLADVSGMTFAVESGKQYNGTLTLWYSVSATNQCCQVAISCPAGDMVALVSTYGQSTPSGVTTSHLEASGSATGVTATDTAAGARRRITISLTYDCTADGTLAVQYRRGGTSGSTGATVRKGSGGKVLVSA
jgi:hypothetical protein